MSAESNAELVENYLAARRRKDFETAFSYLAEDASQRLMFEMPGLPGVWHGKDELKKFVSHLSNLFPDGTIVDVERIHAAADSVVVESTNRGVTTAGEEYSNRYCFIYSITDGKISEIREYTDSHRAREMLT